MTIKTIRRVVRITMLTTGSLFAFIVTIVLFAAVYFSEPHIEVTEIRSTSIPMAVKVRWNLSSEAEYYEDENGKFYDPRVPIDGVPPRVKPIMSSGTEFVMAGYPYKKVRRNIFTGSVNEQMSDRFDVIGWRVVTPYITLEGEDYIESNNPLEWKGDKTEPQLFTRFGRTRKGDC